MKYLFACIVIAIASTAMAEKRCGWIENPTPANWTIRDAHDTWILSTQGVEAIKGSELLTSPEDLDQYVETNGSYGYYCGCVSGTTIWGKFVAEFTEITKVETKLLKDCLKDPALTAPTLN